MKKLNNIKDATRDAKTTSIILTLLLDVNKSTISNWNSNKAQPSLNTINEIGAFLEISNSDLLISENRKNTGLAKATTQEYKRLLKEGVSRTVPAKDKNGKYKEINNPKMVKALRNFVARYRKEHKGK